MARVTRGDTKTIEHPATPVTLASFMHELKRKACAVCALSAEVRAQLGPVATEHGFSRADQVKWLREACGVPAVTPEILTKHFNQRHDDRES